MAEGLLRHLAGHSFEAFSAGTEPKGLAAQTVQVMREIGIDVSAQRSKSVDEYRDRSFDYVITVCDSARRVCPAFPGAGRRLHWDVEDPSDAVARGIELRDAFRLARDELGGASLSSSGTRMGRAAPRGRRGWCLSRRRRGLPAGAGQ